MTKHNLEYKIKRCREYGVDDQFEAIDEIRDILKDVKDKPLFQRNYYHKKKIENYDKLKHKYSLFMINPQHQAINCAYENMLELDKLYKRFNESKLFSIDGIIKGYRLLKYMRK